MSVLLDFAANSGESPGPWVTVPFLMKDQAVNLTQGVTLTVLDTDCDGNNPGAPGEGGVHDGTTVPQEARDDYLWCQSDARMRIDGLPAGTYSVTVFEGRTTDATQTGKVWSGDANGEPIAENIENFAGSSTTVDVVVAAGSPLYYKHIEDDTGGTSGMMIQTLRK